MQVLRWGYARGAVQTVGIFLVMSGVTAVGCEGGGNHVSAPSTPASATLDVAVSPSGVGLDHATNFQFTASGGVNIASFTWDFGDGDISSGTSPIIAHVYQGTGNFNFTVRATDTAGHVTTATLPTIAIKPVGGTWDLTLVPNPQYRFLHCTSFVAVLVQDGSRITGTMTPTVCSRESLVGRSFPIVCCSVSNPRTARFGGESASYTEMDDVYWNGTLNEDLNSMSGPCTSSPCSSMSAVRRQ